ncbi:EGF-like repeat and discoidin I-like domain-containing protein 3 [Patiria miniata]|uniref:F5/8 type C domain-containing protein n=1 Tax=Patiria miniata TaxID=46514 RepID=A0A914AB69_PATMI|nr:EGF-like repeat and discoidin I-like domain-containing protein 3 [Patiria miniata]
MALRYFADVQNAIDKIELLLVGVESQQRVCYSGPPPEPDPDNPDDWMKQVMQEIRKRCPGRKQPTLAGSRPTITHTLAVCSSPQPLGMEDGTIRDNRITASSSSDCCAARYGRLNHFNKRWIALSDDANPWIEVDLVQSTVVTGVTTKGSGYIYVKRYKVAYQQQPSFDRKHVTDGKGNIQVFIGNTDDDTPVTNLFDESVEATVVRIEPTEVYGGALQLELLGCRRD